jgi:hypothetical protein
MTRTPTLNVTEQMRTLPWNFRLRFWINQHNLVIVLLSVPVAVVLLILLVHFNRAATDWPVALTLVVALFTFAYTVQKQELEESKLFRELFGEFNSRYDEMDPQLNQILWEDDQNKPLSLEQKDTLNRYFNLCAEEFLYFRKGYIDPRVWDAWIKGMTIYCQNARVRKLWSKELENGSYYGFTLPCVDE